MADNRFSSQTTLSQLVKAFNALPRRSMTPSGLLRNHWHISIRHIELQPPGDVVFFYNLDPNTNFMKVSQPLWVSDIESTEATVIITRILMEGFLSNLGADAVRGGVLGQPWTWVTNDKRLGQRVTELMRTLGVTEEAILKMPVASEEENGESDDGWEKHYWRLVGAVVGRAPRIL